MNSKLLITLTAFAVTSASLNVAADDNRNFSRRSSTAADDIRSAARSLFTKQPRQKLRPLERIFLNNAVYRYEGRPGLRHDEVSSPEIIFHVDNRSGRIEAGHAWDKR